MSRFLTNPPFVFDATGRKAALDAALVYCHPLRRLRVPTCFQTDFASIPRLFWALLPKLDRHLLAAVLHDWLYRTQIVSRAESDAIFLEAMGDLGVPAWKRRSMYVAVRLFGWYAWRRASTGDPSRPRL